MHGSEREAIEKAATLMWENLGTMTRQQAWRALRGMRAKPPGMAAVDDARLRVFNAALEQGQQFMDAAAASGYATRPLFVFYGLSQLGRSITAASTRLIDAEPADSDDAEQRTGKPGRAASESWRPSAHGITVPSWKLRQAHESGLSAVSVRGKNNGILPIVARALNSPTLPLNCDIPLTDLWAMLPEGQQVPPPGTTGKPAMLACRKHFQMDWVGPIEWALVKDYPGPATTRIEFTEIPESLHEAPWSSYVAWFPGLEKPREPDSFGQQGRTVNATWVANMDDFNRSTDEWKYGIYDTPVDPELLITTYRGAECAVPIIGNMKDALHPLVIWWSVLFSLSILARYEPDTWLSIMDTNSSETANSAEHLLDTVLDVIPELVLGAIKESVREAPTR